MCVQVCVCRVCMQGCVCRVCIGCVCRGVCAGCVCRGVCAGCVCRGMCAGMCVQGCVQGVYTGACVQRCVCGRVCACRPVARACPDSRAPAGLPLCAGCLQLPGHRGLPLPFPKQSPQQPQSQPRGHTASPCLPCCCAARAGLGCHWHQQAGFLPPPHPPRLGGLTLLHLLPSPLMPNPQTRRAPQTLPAAPARGWGGDPV